LRVAREYIGVDWTKSSHDQGNVDVICNVSSRLPFPDNIADVVTAFQVMEHLPEPAVFLAESYRILRPGGGLFITVPFMWHVHEGPYDYYRYTRYGLEYLLSKSGFMNITIRENTGFWQTVVLKFNYHMTRFAFRPVRYLFIAVWWVGQTLAPLFDRLDPHGEETASYTVLAEKPGSDTRL
jgi:SAM-dependent methyltransferase